MLELIWNTYPDLQYFMDSNPERNTFYDSHGMRHIDERSFWRSQLIIYRRDVMIRLVRNK